MFSMAMGWNKGEEMLQKALRIPDMDNPTATTLTAQASSMLQRAPLLAIGTLDKNSQPWTALWGGSPGFSEPIGGGFVGTTTLVDGKYDPVVQVLLGDVPKGEMLQPMDGGKMLAGLAIDLVTRKRVKVAGKMAAGAVREIDIKTANNTAAIPSDAPKKQDQIQLVTKIEQSLGNCPKYLNQYELTPALLTPTLIAEGPSLSPEGKALIDKADMFFLSTAGTTDMDTNHRGGPPGFVRIISPTCIIYPEYSGNRYYQSLGNLHFNPGIGLTFPDYETGNVLYTTGTAELLVGPAAEHLLPGTNLAVKIHLKATRFVAHGLPFRGERKINGLSPYNPHVRTLASEGNIKALPAAGKSPHSAQLVTKTLLTPSVARFAFRVPGGVTYTPGQWVALSFKEELDIGYSHMRNDDPRSLNDDFVRTFTISSFPRGEREEGFEITIRSVGPATEFMFRQEGRGGVGMSQPGQAGVSFKQGGGLEIPILGIGGEFRIAQDGEGVTPFIAGGVGVTPVLGQIGELDLRWERFRLLWAVRSEDVDFVVDTFTRHPELAAATELFVTGKDVDGEKLAGLGAKVELRRLAKSDLDSLGAEKWYLCAGKTFRKQVVSWLPGKEVVFEDFDY